MTSITAKADPSQGLGATPADWAHWRGLNLTADLLPVVSDTSVPLGATKIKQLDGKTPTVIENGKARGLAGWPTRVTTVAEVTRWTKDGRHGIGLIGRQVKAFDIDIDDETVASAVRGMLELTLGALPCRGRPGTGKKLLAFRLAEPVGKAVIKTPHGKVELLGDSQQFLLIGLHKSGTRYTWEGGLPAEIPTLTRDEVEAAWQALAETFGTSESKTRGPYVMRPPVECDGVDRERDLVVEHWDVDHEDAKGRLHGLCPWWTDHTDPDPDEMGGMYIPAAVNGQGHSGFKCQHAHCEHRTVFDFTRAIGVEAEKTLDEFEIVTQDAEQQAADAIVRAKNAEKVTNAMPRPVLETQRERAVRIGREGEHSTPTQRVMTGTEMLEELMFIAEGSRVSFVTEPRFVLPFEEFKRFTAGSIETTKNAAGRAAKVHRAALWAESRDRKTVRCQTFAPGRAGVCVSPDNVLAQNLWMPRMAAAPVNWRELAAPFFEHVAYLVPEPAERERFLDWMAHIEQDPGTLPSTHYLLVAKQTGIGRNWLAYALARVFAGHTALGFDLGEALRSGFNGALSQTLLAVVDELHEGGPGGSNKPAAEKLKSMLTESTRRVNPKYGRQHVEFNCARFLMFSNHEAALPLADNDRRVVVIENPSERRGEDYYRQLYALLEDPGLGAALAEAFKQRDISGFNPGEVAPMTAAKARTIRAGRSEVEQAVRDVAAEWPSDCITSSRLTAEVTEALGGKTWNTQSVCVAAGLVKYPGRVKVDGVAAHVWALRDQRTWCSAPPADVAAEVRRGAHIANVSEFA